MKILVKSKFFGDSEINLSEAFDNKKIISEGLSEADIEEVEKLIKKSFKDNIKSVKSEIETIVKGVIDKNVDEDRIVEIVTNCLVQLYKTFWIRRSSWTSAIKNKAN